MKNKRKQKDKNILWFYQRDDPHPDEYVGDVDTNCSYYFSNVPLVLVAGSAGAVEYTNCFSAGGG